MARPSGEFNAAPMADIAFLLLIFFLVATTFDVDSGIMRRLPPIPDEQQRQQQEDQQIKERNVFEVLINSSDQLLVGGERADISNLKEQAKEFIANPNNEPDLPEMEVKEVPFFGQTECTKGIISLQNDRGTSYGMYIKVQNELTAAYNELKQQLATQQFGEEYSELEKEEQDAIDEIYPMIISEAEPKNVGQ
ncbi:MAG: biopolymer transporter ExbD [Bacteroidales bacterium]|nr:biopolymer transporter ExbD [Bacteroidales bacterium]MBS3773604.1 biopolymer transporter ExbD [Bacteroidales bacterium]